MHVSVQTGGGGDCCCSEQVSLFLTLCFTTTLCMLQVRSSLHLLTDQEQHKQHQADTRLHFNINSASCGPLGKLIAQPSPNRSHQITASQGVLLSPLLPSAAYRGLSNCWDFLSNVWGSYKLWTGLNCESLLLYPFSYFTSKSAYICNVCVGYSVSSQNISELYN